MFGLGLPEVLMVGAVFALLFGPSQLPKLGRSMGETIREFRNIGKQMESDDE